MVQKKKVIKKGITAHPYVKQVMSEQEQPKPVKKKFLDKPVRDIFSFDVEKEIKDNADRSRKVVDNFNREGITIIPRPKKISQNAWLYLIMMLVVGVFVLVAIPFGVVKAITTIIIGGATMYVVIKELKRITK